MYRATVDWPTENPSFSSSPWILGAPQFGLARAISAMRRRTAASFRGRPNGPRDFHFQKRRKPCRCQPTTVSGLTMRKCAAPMGPDLGKAGPEGSVDGGDRRMRRPPVEEGELLAESQVLEHQLPAGPKSGMRREE